MVQPSDEGSLRALCGSRLKTPISVLLAVFLNLAYVRVSGTWQTDDVIAAFRLAGILWLPPAFLIHRWIRCSCVDSIEALTLAAAGSFSVMTAVNSLFNTLAVWWPPAGLLWPATIAGCAFPATAIAVRAAWRVWSNAETTSRQRKLPWLMAIDLSDP